jgi:hypothetical protein
VSGRAGAVGVGGVVGTGGAVASAAYGQPGPVYLLLGLLTFVALIVAWLMATAIYSRNTVRVKRATSMLDRIFGLATAQAVTPQQPRRRGPGGPAT